MKETIETLHNIIAITLLSGILLIVVALIVATISNILKWDWKEPKYKAPLFPRFEDKSIVEHDAIEFFEKIMRRKYGKRVYIEIDCKGLNGKVYKNYDHEIQKGELLADVNIMQLYSERGRIEENLLKNK